jgi:phytoene dehydrogenase-like protein
MLRWPSQFSAAWNTAFRTLEQGSPLWNLRFHEEFAPALISGVAAHSIGRMPNLATSAVGVVLGMLGHERGWPVPVGGSKSISEAMISDVLAHGGRIETSHAISDVAELDAYGTVIFDTSARGLAEIAGSRLPDRYVRKLRKFRFGDGATKVDFVLNGPIPWADSRVHESATVHLGGSRAEVAATERQVARGEHPDLPYILLTQPSAFDPGRNPAGVHAVGSYTHVPNGSTEDMRERVIAQISRFAPGFRDRIVAVHQTTAAELGSYNRNYVGGDFSAGAVNLRQLVARPVFSATPWRTPTPGIYLASSSTPPGPGVHGLSGWYAAREALQTDYGLALPELGISND